MDNKLSLGLIGGGFIGKSLFNVFNHYTNTRIFDLINEKRTHSLPDVVSQDVIIVAVNTPMNLDGSADISILRNALEMVRNNTNFLKPVIVKSTVPPDLMGQLIEEFKEDLFLVFSPEFLTERTAEYDLQQSTRFIFGVADEVLYDQYVQKDMIDHLFATRFPAVPRYWVSYKTASLVKYFTNGYFSNKISLFNEYKQIADKLNVDWTEVISLTMLDPRIGRSHFQVPGHDGKAGFGGHCLIPSSKVCTKNGFKTLEEISVGDSIFDGSNFTKIIEKNERIVSETIEIRSRGVHLEGSTDHIQLVYKNGKLVQKLFKDLTRSDWVYIPKLNIESIKEVFLDPKPNDKFKWWPKSVKLTPALGRVIGLYLAEGCSGLYGKDKDPTITWTFGHNEEYLADEVVSTLKDLGVGTNKKYEVSNGTFGISKTWKVRVRTQGFYNFFEKLKLGHTAFNKNCPVFSEEIAEAVIGGWLDGDGNYINGNITGFSRSKDLIRSIFTMLLNLGVCPTLSQKEQNLSIATKDSVRKVSKWTRRFKFNENNYKRKVSYKSPHIRIFKNGWITKITDIKRYNESKRVISIETNSKKYVANNIVTHNCFIKDVNALRFFAKTYNIITTMMDAVWKKNVECRGAKNLTNELNNMLGRASSKKFSEEDLLDL